MKDKTAASTDVKGKVKRGENMEILKISKVNIFLVGLMMAILLCWSSQAQADQDGDYVYTVTADGEAQIAMYMGDGVNVTIPSTLGGIPVTSIGNGAFSYRCPNVTSISIPQTVTSIGTSAFIDCDSLTSITVVASNSNYASIDGVLYNKAGTMLIACPRGLNTISIPQGVTSIGDDACYG